MRKPQEEKHVRVYVFFRQAINILPRYLCHSMVTTCSSVGNSNNNLKTKVIVEVSSTCRYDCDVKAGELWFNNAAESDTHALKHAMQIGTWDGIIVVPTAGYGK